MKINAQKSKFEDLGSLSDFFSKYGVYTISFEDVTSTNICLLIRSEQEIEFKILCSIALSEIIRLERELPENIEDYHVMRIKSTNNTSYLRVSQGLRVEGDPNLSIMENVDKTKDLKGSIFITFKLSDLNSEKD